MAVLSAKARPYTRPNSLSAIDKQPVPPQAVYINALGIEGDEQGDLRVHGGVDKALHLYPWEHYATWQAQLGAHALLQRVGAFGENFTTQGLTEQDVCIGDILQVGQVRLQVTQARQPCWKLNDRFAIADMAWQMQQQLLTGWYMRVLQTGWMRNGDSLVLVARPHADWSLHRLLQVLYQQPLNNELLLQMQALPLTASWQRLIARRLQQQSVEDWQARLTGDV